MVAGERGDAHTGPRERREVGRIGGWRGDVDAARDPTRSVRHLDVADHEVGGAEKLEARLEEGVRVGLVEDQVAEEQQPHLGSPSTNRSSEEVNAASSHSRASALSASISRTGIPASSSARVTK